MMGSYKKRIGQRLRNTRRHNMFPLYRKQHLNHHPLYLCKYFLHRRFQQTLRVILRSEILECLQNFLTLYTGAWPSERRDMLWDLWDCRTVAECSHESKWLPLDQRHSSSPIVRKLIRKYILFFPKWVTCHPSPHNKRVRALKGK